MFLFTFDFVYNHYMSCGIKIAYIMNLPKRYLLKRYLVIIVRPLERYLISKILEVII